MSNQIQAKKIYYFERQGKENMMATLIAAKERAKELEINKVLIFTGNGEGPEIAIDIFKDSPSIKIIAVTFPSGQSFEIDEDTEVLAGIPDSKVRKRLNKAGVEIVQGVMPLQDILLPGVKDIKLQTIVSTLELFGGGITLCVEAMIMACDSGKVEPGEEVIALGSDTAIVARASRKALIFSPFDGMEIKEIICKPRNHTMNRPGFYEEQEQDEEYEGEYIEYNDEISKK